jgi:hypothetical protein
VILAVGIMLCIVSVIPVIALNTALNIPIISDGVGPSMLFTLVAVGVFLIVFSSGRNKAYKKLLSLNKKVFAQESMQQFADTSSQSSCSDPYMSSNTASGESVSIERVSGAVVESDNKSKSYNSYEKPEQSSDSTEKKVKNFIRAMVKDYWKSVLCIYIIWSFFTFSWGSSWIIWPLAAIFRKPIEQYFLGDRN